MPAKPSPSVAFIGGGFMAEVHGRAARAARATLVGVASSSAVKAAAAAEAGGFERAYASVDELIADERVDLVHIVSPNATHREFALAALAAGKHVVCEKPLATSAADAAELVAAAEAAGTVTSVPFVYRFHTMAREARARVARGELGRLFSIHGSYLQDWLLASDDDNWRVDAKAGGPSRAFADIGSHLVDLTEFITGDRIVRLNALTSTVFAERATTGPVTTEDLAAVVMQTASGAIGTLLVSQVAPGRKNRLSLEIHGSAESLHFDQEHPELLWIGKRTGSELQLRNAEELAPAAAPYSILPPGHALGYQDAFNAFVADTYRAVAGDEPDGLPTFADGHRAAVITDAVLESAANGTWIDITAKEQS